MSDGVRELISELSRAANNVHSISYNERGRLMERAAATIRDYRLQIAYSDAPDNDSGSGDIAYELAVMGWTPEAFASAEVSAKLLDAVDVIKTLRVLMEKKGSGAAGEVGGDSV